MADEILLKIRADIKDLKTKVGNIESQFSGSSRKIQADTDKISNSFKNMGNILKAALSAAILYKFKRGMEECMKAAMKQEAATRSLVSILNTMQTATADETKELIKLSEALQKTTTFGDDQIQSAMAMAGTFKLTADQIKQVIPRAMDMAAAIEMMTGRQMDLADVTNMIGKSLNGTIGFLTRYGVVIDEEAVKTDKFSGVLKSLDDNFKNQAKTLTETTQGAMKQFGNEISDIKEKIGEMFLPALRDITVFLRESFLPALDKVINGFHKFSTMIGIGTGIAHVNQQIRETEIEMGKLKKQFESGEISVKQYIRAVDNCKTRIKYLHESLNETGQEIINQKNAADKVVDSFGNWNEKTGRQIDFEGLLGGSIEEVNEKIKDRLTLIDVWEAKEKRAWDEMIRAKAEGVSAEPIISERKDYYKYHIKYYIEGEEQRRRKIEDTKNMQDELNKSWIDSIQYVYDLGRAIDLVFSRATDKGKQLTNMFWQLLGTGVGFAVGGAGGATIGQRAGANIGGLITSSSATSTNRTTAELSNKSINTRSITSFQVGVQ